MSVEISRPEGLNFEAKLTDTNFEQFFEALPKVFEGENLTLGKLDSGEIGIFLGKLGFFIELHLTTEKDELEETLFSKEDLPVLSISMEIMGVENSETEEFPYENAFLLMRHLEKPFFERFRKTEEMNLHVHASSGDHAKVHLDIDLMIGPTVQQAIENLSFTINVAKEKSDFIDKLSKMSKSSLN